MKDKHDVIIIGGGILGTFHAFHSLRANKSVLQLEKDNFAIGSTVRNFGQVVSSGMENEWFEYGRAATAFYNEIQSEFDISVRNNGSLYLASDDDEVQLLHELKQHYDSLDYSCELLTAQSVLQKHPAIKKDYVKEALFFPQEVSVEPQLMIHKLQEYLKHKFENYTILYNTPVIACEKKSEGVEVKSTTGQTFKAEKAIICNGYEFKLLFPELFAASGIVISKLQMMKTVPMPEVALEGNILTGLTTRRYESFEHHCPSFKNIQTPDHYRELKEWGIHILFKKTADGGFIVGDSHEYASVNNFDNLGYDLNQYVNELMLTEAQRIVNFDVRQIHHYWAGFYPQHPYKHIVTEDIDECIHIRTAIGGKGMTASAGYALASINKILNQ
jgi:FAD dependent oxidoreductase TIGR03364